MTLALAPAVAGTGPGSRLGSGRRPAMTALKLLASCGAVVLCLLMAPTAVGGPASYVVTDGTSMLPVFRADGLVITRTQDAYHVGDVVAYRNPDLQAVVLHRIVARAGDRYMFKGDNNDYRDQYQATRADIVGKEWVYWPGAGRYLRFLRDPGTFAVIVGLVALVSLRVPRRRSRRRRHHGW